MSSYPQDTIVAIATPPGSGAVGIVRLSGPQAIPLADQHVRLKRSLTDTKSNRVRFGRLLLSGEADEVLVFVSRRPNSYTGEDTAEIQCHGSPALLSRLTKALERAGARAAEPGEFTRRAFLNGRVDLTQAEAVVDLVSASTDVSLDAAYFQLRGGLKTRFVALNEELRQTRTLLEASLDFAEDAQIDTERVTERLHTTRQILRGLLTSYEDGKLIRSGARVALVGRPNVGKSSLMNALLGQDRAIVTEIAGTTRDSIEESIEIGGIQVVLTDTAGLRETGDPVEQEGTRRTKLVARDADLILFVVDGSGVASDDALEPLDTSRLRVVNKSDLGVHESWSSVEGFKTSARTGAGLDQLRAAVRKKLTAESQPDIESITNERHAVCLERATDALGRAIGLVREGSPGEVISFEVEEAMRALGEIVGDTTPQEILNAIFSQFCIGK